MRIVRNLDSLEKLVVKRRVRKNSAEEKVSKIIKDITVRGDDALLDYTKDLIR